jgi:flagellar FliL protein
MSDENPETPKAEGGDKPKGGGGGLALVALLLGLLNLGATGFLVFKTLTAHPAPAVAHEEKAANKNDEGPVVSIEPFVDNLRDEGVSRYLKTSFELEVADKETSERIEKTKRGVRDEVLRFLSGLTVAETLGEDGKQRIQDGIVARLDKQLGAGKIKKLYFLEFVIQ